jgi:phosphoglycerate kinase
MRSIKSIKNLPAGKAGIKNKTVLVRVDFNVPIENGKVLDDFRIRAALPTINFLLQKGAKIILLTHLGKDGKASLEPVINRFFAISKIDKNKVAFFPNLRKFPGEMKNNPNFAKKLSSLGDIYVNEAFSVSHRAHASIVSLPKYLPHFAGLQLEKEVKNLSVAFKPRHPFLLILGGIKFETKLGVLNKFLPIADKIFIGGTLVVNALQMPIAKNSKIIFPVGDPTALDANAETLEILKKEIKKAKFILWNGPLGNYENGFTKGTIELAKMIGNSKAFSIIGGGDTVAAVEKVGLKKFSFVSTGGGAMLNFLANGTLPGIKALK